MIGACVIAAPDPRAALLVGQALAAFAGGATRRRPVAVSWLAPAYGIAALLVLGGIAVRLPGHAVTAAVVLVARHGARGAAICGGGSAASARRPRRGAPVVAITCSPPRCPSRSPGFIGILGVGLINDDMASHLIIADYIGHYSGHVPSFIKGGYPIGPHAVVAGVSRADRRRPRRRLRRLHAGAGAAARAARRSACSARCRGIRLIVGGSLIALPYLGAAYLSQGAFKEPLQAMLLIGFALSLAALLDLRTPLSELDDEPAVRPAVHPLKRVLPLGDPGGRQRLQLQPAGIALGRRRRRGRRAGSAPARQAPARAAGGLARGSSPPTRSACSS